MANEIQLIHDDGAETVYAIVRDTAGNWYHGTNPEAFDDANWGDYDIALAEVHAAASGNVAVQATFPAVAAGFYWLDVYVQAGANPAQTDFRVCSYLMYWNATALVPAGGAADVRQIDASEEAAANVASANASMNPVGNHYVWIGDSGTSSCATLACYLLNGVTPASLPVAGDTLLVDDATDGYLGNPIAGVLEDGVLVTFVGESYNRGTVGAGATFNDSSVNSGGTVGDGATFNDSSENSGGTVGDGATFNGSSCSSNGTVGDGAVLNTTHAQAGTFSGSVLMLRACNISGATIAGPISYAYDTQAATAGTVDARLAAYDSNGGVAKQASVGAIATILAGITSLAHWLRGLYNKRAMNSEALTEIQNTTGTFDPTTDSVEALADNVPANVWANPVRTLTMSAAEAAAAMTGGASNSFLTRTRANIREFAGEPGIHAKYSDARLLDWIEMAFSKVFGALSRRADNPICMTYDITLSSGQPHYQLPPTCQRVLQAQVFTAGDMDNPVWELHPRARSHPAGYNIVFEHTTVRLSPATIAQLDGYVLRVTFVPSGCVKLHTASIDTDDDDDDTGNITNGTTTATVVLPTQTNINATGAGTLDLRPNAYGGSIFRVLSAGAANYVQERLITAYDVTTRTLTLSPQFDAGLVPATDTDTNVVYEIAPPLVEQFDAVIAAWVAMMIVGLEGDKARYGGIATLYQDMLSDAAKQVQNFNGITSGTLNGGSSGGSSGSMASLMNRGR